MDDSVPRRHILVVGRPQFAATKQALLTAGGQVLAASDTRTEVHTGHEVVILELEDPDDPRESLGYTKTHGRTVSNLHD